MMDSLALHQQRYIQFDVIQVKWGELLGVLDCHHWDLVPKRGLLKGQKGPGFDPIEFYLSLVTKLHDLDHWQYTY